MFKNYSYLLLFFSIVLIGFNSCEEEEEEHNITGCTNPDAANYNPDATIDDGSCVVLGCTDPTAINYNPDATDDNGSCEYSIALMLDGNWNIAFLDYETELDLSFLEELIGIDLGNQEISGQVEDAGTWSFNSTNYTYSSELDFETEPFTIITFEVPGIPFNYSNSGTWELTNNDSDLILTDELTGEQADYEILDITQNSASMNGSITVSQDVMGTNLIFELDVYMQLEKITN